MIKEVAQAFQSEPHGVPMIDPGVHLSKQAKDATDDATSVPNTADAEAGLAAAIEASMTANAEDASEVIDVPLTADQMDELFGEGQYETTMSEPKHQDGEQKQNVSPAATADQKDWLCVCLKLFR